MINAENAALTAIDIAMELSIHTQEVGRELPAPRAKYIEVFYNFITADTPQNYDIRVSALRTKISSVKTEMSGEFRTQLNNAHMGLINNLEKQALGAKKMTSKHEHFDLPNIGINDQQLMPESVVEHAQRIANKFEKMSNAILSNNWSLLAAIDQDYVQQKIKASDNDFSASVQNRREKTDAKTNNPPPKGGRPPVVSYE